MKKPILKKIEIPNGVSIEINEGLVKVKGPEGEVSRKFNLGKVRISVKENKFIAENEKATKNEKKIINTIYSHVKNMMKGVQKKFEYKLKICFGHFPFTVRQEGKKIFIKNFLGEKIDRIMETIDGTEIDIKKEIITVKSADKELAGQMAANFETATKVKARDLRIFQDGVYIIEKDGKKI
jgi:large subunit ribosomal protein L6